MIELTDENFQKEVLESDKYVLVDFYMSGCFPCKMIAPIIEKIAKTKRREEGKIVFAKAKLKNVLIYCEKYRINSAPTIILFKDGKAVSGFIGYREEKEIREWLAENVKREA